VNLAGFAGAVRALADRAEASLAKDCVEAAAPRALDQLRIVTPVQSGALRGSEHVDAIFGSGTFATAVLAPHKIYAKFRNDGGTITAKKLNARGQYMLGTPAVGFFGRSVTQAGAHYMEKGEAAGRGPVAEACAQVAAFYFDL